MPSPGIHLGGMMFCCKHAVRAMLQGDGGSIVDFSSAASFNFDPVISFAYSVGQGGDQFADQGLCR